jgi:site-specific DNA-methyltransferase (cytosine-N4-specific)
LENPEGFYQPKKHPSGHDIGKSFGKNNGGAIPSNLLEIPNSESNSSYLSGCKAIGAKPHPARFPLKLPEFFIKFLTEPEDLVVDIFAGSNTPGYVAEVEKRRWLAFDECREYLAASSFRFLTKGTAQEKMHAVYDQILSGETVHF